MVEHPGLDRKGGRIRNEHTKGLNILKRIKTNFDLIDPWRTANPKKREYTWKERNKNRNIESRLDRFYTTSSIMTYNFDFLATIWSDHKIISFEVTIGKPPSKGTNYWKLNTSILEDKEYVDQMTNLLNHRKK